MTPFMSVAPVLQHWIAPAALFLLLPPSEPLSLPLSGIFGKTAYFTQVLHFGSI
jgi:hypothetical protein